MPNSRRPFLALLQRLGRERGEPNVRQHLAHLVAPPADAPFPNVSPHIILGRDGVSQGVVGQHRDEVLGGDPRHAGRVRAGDGREVPRDRFDASNEQGGALARPGLGPGLDSPEICEERVHGGSRRPQPGGGGAGGLRAASPRASRTTS